MILLNIKTYKWRCGYVIVGIWAFGLLEEGGADFCLFYDDFSVLS